MRGFPPEQQLGWNPDRKVASREDALRQDILRFDLWYVMLGEIRDIVGHNVSKHKYLRNDGRGGRRQRVEVQEPSCACLAIATQRDRVRLSCAVIMEEG